METLNFRQALAEHLDLGMEANCQYQDWQLPGLIVYSYLCGYRQLSHLEQLRQDSTVQKLLARHHWQGVPDEPATEYCTFTQTCTGWDGSREFVGIRFLKEVVIEGCFFTSTTTIRSAISQLWRRLRSKLNGFMWTAGSAKSGLKRSKSAKVDDG